LSDIQEELDAEDLSIARREELADEGDKCRTYLDGAVGLGGRARTIGGGSDSQAVGVALKRALASIEEVHPRLHKHLDDALRNRYGNAVCYKPTEPTSWDVSMGVHSRTGLQTGRCRLQSPIALWPFSDG
jgi:hypothetical protein